MYNKRPRICFCPFFMYSFQLSFAKIAGPQNRECCRSVLRIRFLLIRIRILLSLWCGSRSYLWCGSGSYLSIWCGSGSYPSLFPEFVPSNDPKWSYKDSTFSHWCVSGSRTCFSLWCGCGSGCGCLSSFLLWCGSGSCFPKWCGSESVTLLSILYVFQKMYVNRTHYLFSKRHCDIDTHKFDFFIQKCRKNTFKKTNGDSIRINRSLIKRRRHKDQFAKQFNKGHGFF